MDKRTKKRANKNEIKNKIIGYMQMSRFTIQPLWSELVPNSATNRDWWLMRADNHPVGNPKRKV
jgi:hypothetical protein